MKTLKIDRKPFYNWYFSSKDDIISLGESVISCLKDDGKYNITDEDILNNLGYIPLDVILNTDIIDGEDIDNDALEYPEKYSLEFYN